MSYSSEFTQAHGIQCETTAFGCFELVAFGNGVWKARNPHGIIVAQAVADGYELADAEAAAWRTMNALTKDALSALASIGQEG